MAPDEKSIGCKVIPWTPVSILIEITNIFTSSLRSQESSVARCVVPVQSPHRFESGQKQSKGS